MHLGRKRAMARDLVSFEPVVAGRHQIVERRAQVGVSAATVLLHARNLLLMAGFWGYRDLGVSRRCQCTEYFSSGSWFRSVGVLVLGFGGLGSRV